MGVGRWLVSGAGLCKQSALRLGTGRVGVREKGRCHKLPGGRGVGG